MPWPSPISTSVVVIGFKDGLLSAGAWSDKTDDFLESHPSQISYDMMAREVEVTLQIG